MDILTGLNPTQLKIIHNCRTYQEFRAGQAIFNEGEPADSMFTIITGRVEIFRAKGGTERRIAELAAPEVFGEMGLLTRAGRTASARALENTLLFEVPTNLVPVMLEFSGPEATMKLLENLLFILAERLRKKNEETISTPGASVLGKRDIIRNETNAALDAVERNLPKILGRTCGLNKRLKPGEYLCRQGDDADGFYFIHRGEMEIVKENPAAEPEVLSRIKGPTITGEIGFFTRTNRSASVRALTEADCTLFSGSHFLQLKTTQPAEALAVLFAAARLTVYLLVKESA